MTPTAGGIGNMLRAVDQKADLNAMNPNKLEKEVKASKGKDMIAALALQDALDTYKSSKQNIEAGNKPPEPTVMEQRGEQVLQAAMEKVQGNAQTGMGVKQKSQQKAQKGMLRNALGQQQGGVPGLVPQQPKPQIPQGIAGAGRPPMPQGMPQRPQMPQGMPQRPQGMPQGMPMARGGLARFQEGGDVEAMPLSERKKKEYLTPLGQKAMGGLRSVGRSIAEDPAGAAGTALMLGASAYPATAAAGYGGRLIKGGIDLAKANKGAIAQGAKKAVQGTKDLGKKIFTKPKMSKPKFTATPSGPKMTQPAKEIGRQIRPAVASGAAGIAGLGLLGMGGEDAPQQAAPVTTPPPAAPVAAQASELDKLRANKPNLPMQDTGRMTAINAGLMALDPTNPLAQAGMAAQARRDNDFDKMYQRAVDNQETWAKELNALVTQDVNRVSNLTAYGRDLEKSYNEMLQLLDMTFQDVIMEYREDPNDEGAKENYMKYLEAKRQLDESVLGRKMQQVRDRMGKDLGISGQAGI